MGDQREFPTVKRETEPKCPVLYYDIGSGDYWLKIYNRWVPLSAKDAKIHLRVGGLSKDSFVGHLNELEQAVYRAQIDRCVDYAGPLSGYRAGVLDTSQGKRLLVTSESPAFDAPRKKSPTPWWNRFTLELLGKEQQSILFDWLAVGFQTFVSIDFRPGQMLGLAGPPRCGKSLLIDCIVELFGGSSASPYDYMIGQTGFNSDLAKVPLLVIDDQPARIDIRSRREFGARMKEMTVLPNFRVHAKGREAFSIPTFRRLILAVNDEPENLSMLPPLDGSILEKLILLRCQMSDVGCDRKKTWSALLAELSGIRWMIANRPVKPVDPRFVVAAYADQDLLDALNQLSPEHTLLELIDEVLFGADTPRDQEGFLSFRGTSDQVEKKLLESSLAFKASKLFHYSSACGTFLGRLAKRYPARFQSSKVRGSRRWTISPPSESTEETKDKP